MTHCMHSHALEASNRTESHNLDTRCKPWMAVEYLALEGLLKASRLPNASFLRCSRAFLLLYLRICLPHHSLLYSHLPHPASVPRSLPVGPTSVVQTIVRAAVHPLVSVIVGQRLALPKVSVDACLTGRLLWVDSCYILLVGMDR